MASVASYALTPAGAVGYLLVLALLFAAREAWRAVNRCTYCGVVGGHEPDCPHKL